MAVEITTNNVPRELFMPCNLPTEILKSEFDYIDLESDEAHTFRLFKYRGSWYDVQEFVCVNPDGDLTAWDGLQSETYFSGVLIKYPHDEFWHYDMDSVIVGSLFIN